MLTLAVLGLGGLALLWKKRRLPRVLFLPEAPSRALDVSDWSPAPPRDAVRVLFVGHSLVNNQMPAMARAIAASLEVELEYDVQLLAGGSLKENWERPPEATGVDARAVLAEGSYDTLVLTEAVDLDDNLMWMDSPDYARRFYTLARTHRPDIHLHFYEVWHPRDASRWLVGYPLLRRWDEMAEADLHKWESIVDRATEDEFTVHLVPGGQALSALVRAIEAGEVPGLHEVDELFLDGIHLSPLGNYFIALVQVACLARRSPVGGATTVPARGEPEGPALEVPPATARRLQEIAWEVVRAYPRSGVLTPPDRGGRGG